jgi:hypothetical protein
MGWITSTSECNKTILRPVTVLEIGEPMTGTDGGLHVIEVVAERLCRDLGGLMASLELASSAAAEASQFDAGSKALMCDTAHRLVTRLQLVQAAWGTGETQPAPLERVLYLAGGLPRRITVDGSGVEAGTVFPVATGRVLLNLLLLTADGLPLGGVVRLAGTAGDLFIQIDGPDAVWPPGMAVCLANATDARAALNEPHSLQMALAALLARAAGIRLSILLAPNVSAGPAVIRLGG